MRIERFWAKNYRSLADVDIRFDGDIDVFYGKNGAGKSNIFRGLETLFDALRGVSGDSAFEPGCLKALSVDERYRGAPSGETTVLGAVLVADESAFHRAPKNGRLPAMTTTRIDVELQWHKDQRGWAHKLAIGPAPKIDFGEYFRGTASAEKWAILKRVLRFSGSQTPSDINDFARQISPLFKNISQHKWFSLVSDVRSISFAADLAEQPGLPGMGVPVSELLNQGRLAEALFSAKNSGDPDLNARWFDFQEFMQVGLDRPLLDVVTQPGSRQLRLVERVGRDFHPIDLAGLGIQQLYIMFAQIFLSGARCVAIEEPEAHLHMPDTGLTVRRLLRKALDDGEIDQLLIASHDSVFAMDTDAFLEVSLDEQGRTHVERNEDLTDIDRKHVYEPGPILRAVQGVMRDLDGDEIVHTRMDTGAPVTAREMLALIERADPVAREYMEQYQQFVIHLTRARARKQAATGS